VKNVTSKETSINTLNEYQYPENIPTYKKVKNHINIVRIAVTRIDDI